MFWAAKFPPPPFSSVLVPQPPTDRAQRLPSYSYLTTMPSMMMKSTRVTPAMRRTNVARRNVAVKANVADFADELLKTGAFFLKK